MSAPSIPPSGTKYGDWIRIRRFAEEIASRNALRTASQWLSGPECTICAQTAVSLGGSGISGKYLAEKRSSSVVRIQRSQNRR